MICDELPAVTLPSSLKAGFRSASASTVESGRMPSSAERISSVSLPSSSCTVTGTISFSKRPSAVARAARWWLCTRERVEVLARDAPLVGDHLGPDALALQAAVPLLVVVAGHHPRAEGEAEVAHDRRAHRGVGHALDARRDGDVVGAGHDALGGEVDGLLRRSALAVDRRGGHRLGPARRQHRVAADVERLLGDLHDAAHDDVVDQRRVELVALGDGLERLGGQVHGVPAPELPVALAAGRPDGVDDDCGGHDASSQIRRAVPPCRSRSHDILPAVPRADHLAADQGRERHNSPTRTCAARYCVCPRSAHDEPPKNMDRWLGDGGMPIIELVRRCLHRLRRRRRGPRLGHRHVHADGPGLQPARDRPGRHPLPPARCRP